MAKSNKPERSSSQSKKVVNQDTRSLYEQLKIRWLDLDGTGFPEIDVVANYLEERTPDIYKKILAKRSDGGSTLEQIVEVLESELTSKSSDTRLEGIVLLHTTINTVMLGRLIEGVSTTRRSRLINSLGETLKDPDCEVRRAAAKAMASLINDHHKREIAGILIRPTFGITNTDAETALASIKSLAKMDQDTASETVGALCKAAQKHASPEVRVAACKQLKALGEDSLPAIPTLLELAKESNSDEVALAAVEALLAVAKFEDVVVKLKPAADHRLLRLLRRGGEPFRLLRLTIEGKQSAPGGGGAGEWLSKPQRKVLEVVREAKKRLTTEEVLAAMETKYGSASQGTYKSALADLVHRGFLNNRQDVQPPGYGLPEWD